MGMFFLVHAVEDQMCLLKNPFSWIVVFAPFITFASFMLMGSLSIFFASTVLIFSTVLFILSKRKLIHKSIEEICSPQMEDISASKQQPETEISRQSSEEQEGGSYEHQIHDYRVKSPDFMSETECIEDQLSTNEGSELEWPFRDDMDRTPDWSDDGSISDEDSLIEISLPGGHYLGHQEDQPHNKCSMQHKLPDFMPESIFKQRSLLEILAELNEENLIEIDISMGSIKYSRFEIEA